MLQHPSTAAVVVALLLHAALFAIPAVRHSAAPPQALHAVAMDLRLEPEHAPAHPPPEPQKPEEPPPPPQTEQPENPPPPPAQPAEPEPPQPSPAPVAPVAPAPARPKPAAQPAVREKTVRPSPAPPAPRPAPVPRTTATPGYQTASAPVPLRQPPPAYPSDCRRLKQSGTVTLTLFVSEKGTVDRAEVSRSSGFPALDAAALAAVKRWTFRPPVINGQPAKSRVQVPCTFSLK